VSGSALLFVLLKFSLYSRLFPRRLNHASGLDGPCHAYFAHDKLGFDRSEAGSIPSKIVESNFTHLTSEVIYKRKGQARL